MRSILRRNKQRISSCIPPFLGGGGGQRSISNLEKEPEKKWLPGSQSSFHIYLPGGLTVFLAKKDCKIKYGLEDSVSNVDFSTAAKYQLVLCDTLVLLTDSNNIARN